MINKFSVDEVEFKCVNSVLLFKEMVLLLGWVKLLDVFNCMFDVFVLGVD